MKFLATEYMATGEGVTICLMVTNDRQAEQLFRERFGDYFTIGLQELEQDNMLKNYKAYIPNIVKKHVKEEKPGYFIWSGEFHKNLS